MLDEARPDAVVSDIGMPVEDGYFLARELRKREREAGTDEQDAADRADCLWTGRG